MSVRERQTYKVNVTQTREGTVEIDATSLRRAKALAEMKVLESPEEIQWDKMDIDTPTGFMNTRG